MYTLTYSMVFFKQRCEMTFFSTIENTGHVPSYSEQTIVPYTTSNRTSLVFYNWIRKQTKLNWDVKTVYYYNNICDIMFLTISCVCVCPVYSCMGNNCISYVLVVKFLSREFDFNLLALGQIKNKFVFRRVHTFNFLSQITAFTIFIRTFSKIKIKLPILR